MESAIANLEAVGLGDIVFMPTRQAESYWERNRSYWSLTPQLKPYAIVQPRTTKEVSQAINVLVQSDGCKFAVRSGGHMSWAGANNIQDGITVDLGALSQVTYNPDTKLASIGPGGRWVDVYRALESEGVMVAGGREGLVGVGGLLLGGGLTYYTCKYGFACNQVVNYEIILADGTITEANRTEKPDLFWALKGGGNNFGIVTRFDMQTFEARDVWDGIVTFPNAQSDAVLGALHAVTKNIASKPDSHVLAMWSHMPQLAEDTQIHAILTNIEGRTSFEEFLEIPDQIQNTMGKKTMAEKVAGLLVPSNKYDTWFTLTFKNDLRVLKKATVAYDDMIQAIKALTPDLNVQMVLQPLPAIFAANSVARGGNVMGFDRFTDDAIILITAVQVETLELKTSALPIFKQSIREIEEFAMSIDCNIESRYLNYCDGSQDPFASYGKENLDRMRAVAARYDPEGVFQTRVPGGFKISKANQKDTDTP